MSNDIAEANILGRNSWEEDEEEEEERWKEGAE